MKHRYWKRQTFVVTGRGSFPVDMMRYAGAVYSSPTDRAEAARVRAYNDPFTVKIDFDVHNAEWPEMVAERFASFGARMVRYGR